MASWYVGSVQYAAVAQFAISTVYSVGNIVRQLATPAVGSERCFRCTTAGTSAGSEPSWNLTKGATTTSGTATFTEVTGNSTYNWAAPAARLLLMFNTFAAAGDTIYVAQNHAETQASANTLTSIGTSASPLSVFCVNASGSVPPVAADLATTATVSTTGANSLTLNGFAYIYGIIFKVADSSNIATLNINAGSITNLTLSSCGLVINTTSTLAGIVVGATSTQSVVTLINTPITFGNSAQTIGKRNGTLVWRDTPSAILGSVPTTLFAGSSPSPGQTVVQGVDLSAMGSGTTLVGAQAAITDFVFVNCKLGASVVVAATPTSRAGNTASLVVSDSGATGYRQERYLYEGTLTAETTFILTGGASDGVTPISWKVVSTANAKPLFPFESFPIAVWNTSTSLVTATVEIESNATLTNADCWLEVETLDTSGFPISAAHSSAPATPLTTASNLPTSSATWAGGLGSAVKQYLQVTFTPALAGYVRGVVKVGKASQTLYINPQITLT